MKTLLAALCFSLVLGFTGCASMGGTAATPQSATQIVYAAGWTLVGATNSVADLHDAGRLTGDNYQKAKSLIGEANAAYVIAKTSLAQGKPADAQSQILAAQQLLTQLAAYLAAQGVK